MTLRVIRIPQKVDNDASATAVDIDTDSMILC